MGVTIGVAVLMVLFSLAGLFRGVRGGLVALAGTLLATVLVDLWQARWAEWVRATFRPEQPALPTFALTAAVFLGVTLLIGYGGSALLPRPGPAARPGGLVNSLLGALVGALNGALVAAYLLRYGAEIWADEGLAGQVAASPLALTLDSWLPWFILSLVVATAVFVLLRGTVAVARAFGSRPTLAPVDAEEAQAGGKPAPQPAPPESPPTPPRTVTEMDQRVLGKIRDRS